MIELRVLGSLELTGSGERDLEGLRRKPKRAALLAYLAAAPNTFQRRDRLLSLFWPELDLAHARAALSQALHLLRTALGDSAIVARGDEEIALNGGIVWCDSRAFELALDAGRAAEALALYRGELLDGFFIADAPEFERWLDRERERLRHLASRAAWAVAEQRARDGDAVEAARLARRAADFVPADEAVTRRLMQFLRELGDKAAALRAYEAFASQLASEFEVAPSAETQALAAAIRHEPRFANYDSSVTTLPAPAASAPASGPTIGERQPRRNRVVAGVVILALALSATIALGWHRSSARRLVRFALTFDGVPALASGIGGSTIALSPDGSRLVYVGVGKRGTELFVRSMDRLEATPIPHTEGGYLPFFSPSGEWLGFVLGNAIQKVRMSGGPAVTISTVTGNVAGASWGRSNVIAFATPAGLWRVPAGGGAPSLVAPNDLPHRVLYRWPTMLPGGNAVVVSRVDDGGSHLVGISLETGRVISLGLDGTAPCYNDRGFLIFARPDGILRAAPFDARAMRIAGDALPIAEGVLAGIGGATKLGVSDEGALAYVPETPNRSVVIVDRSGHSTPLPIPPQHVANARFSLDGRRIAISLELVGGQSNVWVFDQLTKGRVPVTFDSGSVVPIWNPDGRHIVVASKPGGRLIGFSLRSATVDADEPTELVLESGPGQLPYTFTPDGKALVFRRIRGDRQNEIWILPLVGNAKPYPYLSVAHNERAAAISPDGRWLAYISDESGRDEVYVRTFPHPGPAIPISVGGGREPRWSASAHEIFYRTDSEMVAARLRIGSPPIVESRRVLFDVRPYESWIDGAEYDVHPDGEHFLMIRRPSDHRDVVVVLNWFDQPPTARRSVDSLE
jgi:DNA-binding SARP family transcriptional activator/Tol biopolymer transport system component